MIDRLSRTQRRILAILLLVAVLLIFFPEIALFLRDVAFDK